MEGLSSTSRKLGATSCASRALSYILTEAYEASPEKPREAFFWGGEEGWSGDWLPEGKLGVAFGTAGSPGWTPGGRTGS